jgi:hypothetical protein
VRITGLAVALALAPAVGMGFASGRLTAPPIHGSCPPARGGIHYHHGAPRGFPPTAQGAGDAAAWYITLLTGHTNTPRGNRPALIGRLTVPAARRQVTATVDTTPGGVQLTPLRVWAPGADTPHLKPEGATVAVELYEVAVPATRRQPHPDRPGGRFYLQRILMQRHHHEWLLRHIDAPLTAPNPNAGPATNGDAAMLARVFGSNSWTPYMR